MSERDKPEFLKSSNVNLNESLNEDYLINDQFKSYRT